VSAGLIALLAAGLVRLLGATLRTRTVGVDGIRAHWASGRPVIYAVWHGRLLMMAWANARLRRTAGARPVTVLASRSRDGDLVAAYVGRFGLEAVRGSSSRGGTAALRALVGAVRGGRDVAVVPDGPRGPREQCRPGVVALAALTGAPVVPLAFAARPARRLRTWDRFLVPAPFARGVLVFGPPIHVAPGDDRDRAVKDVARALDDATIEADRLVSA
jgi:lysophospholipid acyltransferase (LPLAT)-like uncharacterized protein